MNLHEVFIHIHQGCFAGTGAIVRLPQCQWSKPDGYGKISQCITTTKHSKAKTVCIFLGIYCMFTWVYFPMVVCLKGLYHDSVSSRPAPCVSSDAPSVLMAFKMLVRHILSSVCLRLIRFFQLSLMQYMGLCVFSLLIDLMIIVRIRTLYLITIIIKSEVWPIYHCVGLGHEIIICAVCHSIFILYQISNCRVPSQTWEGFLWLFSMTGNYTPISFYNTGLNLLPWNVVICIEITFPNR